MTMTWEPMPYDIELIVDEARQARIDAWIERTVATFDVPDDQALEIAAWLADLPMPRWASHAAAEVINGRISQNPDADTFLGAMKAWLGSTTEDERVAYLAGYFSVTPQTASSMIDAVQSAEGIDRAEDGPRCALYRHYDADGRLLYVGISKHPVDRQEQHRYYSPWFKFSARHTIDWYETESDAREAERVSILADQPLFNRTHNRSGLQRSLDYLMELAQPRGTGGAA